MIDNMTSIIRKIMTTTALMITATSAVQANCQESCAAITCCENSCGALVLSGRALYLRAYEGGLSCPCDDTQITNSSENEVIISRLEGKGHEPDFKWNLGFNVGAAYQFTNCNWGVGANWTHYNSNSNDSDDENETNWKLDFDVIDAQYAYAYHCSNCITFVPYVGVRYARIDQKLHTHYVSSVDEVANISDGHFKQDFSGVGPLFGLGAEWGVGCGFSFYGNISGAILYGDFDVTSDNTVIFDTGINIDHLENDTHACQPVLDIGLGVRWKTCFCNDKYLLLQLGLEEHRYFNYNQFGGYGDLSLDGASFSVAIIF